LTALLVAVLLAWLAVGCGPSPPGKVLLSIIDSSGTDVRYPGDLKRIGGPGAEAWVAVYQRSEGGVPTVYAREASALPGPFGSETRVSDPLEGPAYDPGIVELPQGDVIVTWSAEARVFYAERLAPNRYGPGRELFRDPGGLVQEQTVYRFHDTSFVLYGYRPDHRVDRLWDVRFRGLQDGPAVSPPVVVAIDGPGPGTQGVQKRVTAAPTGSARGLIAVWSQHPATPDGPRTISGALSPDAGSTWGPSFEVATFPGHDLVNPFAVLGGPADLRVYFSQDAHVARLGYVRSTDRGRTWSQRRDVALPKGVTAARIVIAVDPGLGTVAFVATVGFGELGTVLLTP
jgi:hypothetical protein